MSIIKKIVLPFVATALFMVGSISAHAESEMDLGDYVVHYNTVATTFLPRQVASAYNIKRSKNKAMVNIAIIKKEKGTTGTPVKGMVSLYSTNLNNQLNKIQLRKITEDGGKAIYYIGEFKVNNNETLNFNLSVSPESQMTPATIKFSKKFFTD